MKIVVVFLALGCLFSSSTRADEVYTFIVKKQEEKKQTRRGWNLADWIAQRNQMRTQDLWLAMHTPTPYEFSIGGDYRFLDHPKDERDHRFSATAYAKIFGIEIERESEPSRWNALLNFRFFGLYQQGTNLTAFVGMRSQSDPQTFRSIVYGASGTLYFSRFAGGEFEYRKYGDGTFDPSGVGAGGSQIEANFFIDFSFLRLYGGYLRTKVDPSRDRGYQAGLRIFF